MAQARVIKIGEAPVFKRNDGVETRLLVGKENCETAGFTSGTTQFPVGKKVPFHSHNCDEQVTILDGEALVEIDGREPVPVGRHDTVFVLQGKSHRLINRGDGPLTILWLYNTDTVTRTFTESGKTVDHLSEGDRVTP
jgi:mannose-6-phosphate isomerase-like protein (cupin superfamily)